MPVQAYVSSLLLDSRSHIAELVSSQSVLEYVQT